MPEMDENKKLWELDIIWKCGGEEWSKAWGGSEIQWHASLYPRILRFLPAGTILEIGSGHGRMSKYLKNYTNKLILVDISESGIKACKSRFAEENHIQYFVNDGRSLDMIDDDSIDFVFSLDALVFVEKDVLEDYIRQLARKLKKDGSAFIQHSNLGEYWYFRNLSRKTSNKLQKLKIIERDHWRAHSVSAGIVRQICNDVGLECIVQEQLVYFSKKIFVDCYSLIVHKDSKWIQKPKLYRNKNFMRDIKSLKRIAENYGVPFEKRPDSPILDYMEFVNQQINAGELKGELK